MLPEKLTPAERFVKARDAEARARFEEQKRQSGWEAIDRPDGSVFLVPAASDGLNAPVVNEHRRFVREMVREVLREEGSLPEEEAARAASVK